MRAARAVLLLGALVVGATGACGDDGDAGGGSSSSSQRSLDVAADPPDPSRCGDGASSSDVSPADLVLTVDPTGALVEGPISWALTLENRGDATVDLVFASGQDGDVVLRDADGTVAYRWSAGQSFTQAIRCQSLRPGERAQYFLGGVLRAPEGRYSLEATVAAQPAPPAALAAVTIG